MKKTTIGIIIAFALLLMVFVLYTVISGRRTNTSPPPLITPTPQLDVTYPPTSQLKVTQISPRDTANNVALDTKITLTYNSTISANNITFSIKPDIRFTQEIQGNNLIITFLQPLSPGTQYVYAVKYPQTKDIPDTFSFTTNGPTQSLQPNTYPGPVIE